MAPKRDETRPTEQLPGGRVTDGLASERALWQQFAQGRDPATREELVRRYMPFARSLALRYRGASESFDDLLQVASLGLVNAVDRFDPSRGTPFAAFASPTILGELKRHFRDRVWTVRVPRGLHDRMAEVDKAINELTVHAPALPLGRRDRRAHGGRPDRRARGPGGKPQSPAPLARSAGRRRGGRIACLGVGRRGGRGLRADRGQARAGGGAAPARRTRTPGPTAALRRRPHPVADRRTDRPLADACLAHPAPHPGTDPRGDRRRDRKPEAD